MILSLSFLEGLLQRKQTTTVLPLNPAVGAAFYEVLRRSPGTYEAGSLVAEARFAVLTDALVASGVIPVGLNNQALSKTYALPGGYTVYLFSISGVRSSLTSLGASDNWRLTYQLFDPAGALLGPRRVMTYRYGSVLGVA